MITRQELSRRLSQVADLRALARDSGLGINTLRRARDGTHGPTLNTLERLMPALKLAKKKRPKPVKA